MPILVIIMLSMDVGPQAHLSPMSLFPCESSMINRLYYIFKSLKTFS
jgi:hypothetical protein